MSAPLDKLAYTLPQFQAIGGPGRVRCYELRNAGRLHFVKDGRRTLILAAEVERYFASLPKADAETMRPAPRRRLAPPNGPVERSSAGRAA